MNVRSARQNRESLLDDRNHTAPARVIRHALVSLGLGSLFLALEGLHLLYFLSIARISGFLGWALLAVSALILLSLLPEFRFLEVTPLSREGSGSERSRRIDALYAELRPLMSRAAADPSLKGEVRAKLSVLRRLQTEEADEMEKRFDAGLLLKPGEGWQALERARELLARYEDPSAPNAPTLEKN